MSVTEAVLRVTGRKPHSGRLFHRTLKIVFIAMVLAVLPFVVRDLIPMINRPVTQIQIVGKLTHLSPAEVAAAADIPSGTRLFDVRMDTLKARVDALPWVAAAVITRQWPGRIRIQIAERHAFARWDGSELIDAHGDVFDPARNTLPVSQWQALPQLAGPAGQGQHVMEIWKKLSAALANGPFALAGLREDQRGGWVGHCHSGVVLRFGRGDPEAKLRLLRDTAMPALSGKLNRIAAIDLRYTNGFAVRWLASRHDQSPVASTKAAEEKLNR